MKGKGKTLLFYAIAFVLLLAIGMGLWLLGKRNPPFYGEKPVIYLYPEEETKVSVTLELDGKLTTTYPLGERSDQGTELPVQGRESVPLAISAGNLPALTLPSRTMAFYSNDRSTLSYIAAPSRTLALGSQYGILSPAAGHSNTRFPAVGHLAPAGNGGSGSVIPSPGTSSVSWQVTAKPDGILTNAAGNAYSYLYWEGETNTEYDLSKGFVVKGEDSVQFLREKLSYMGLTPREYNEFIVYWLPRLEANAYNLITFQGEAYTDSARLTITPEPDCLLRVFMAFKPLAKPINIPEQELTPFARTGFAVVEWGGCELK